MLLSLQYVFSSYFLHGYNGIQRTIEPFHYLLAYNGIHCDIWLFKFSISDFSNSNSPVGSLVIIAVVIALDISLCASNTLSGFTRLIKRTSL